MAVNIFRRTPSLSGRTHQPVRLPKKMSEKANVSLEDGEISPQESFSSANGSRKRSLSGDDHGASGGSEVSMKRIKEEKSDDIDLEQLVAADISQRIAAETVLQSTLNSSTATGNEEEDDLYGPETVKEPQSRVNGANSQVSIPTNIQEPVPEDDNVDEYLYGDETRETNYAPPEEYPEPEETLESAQLPLSVDQFMNLLYEWDPAELAKSSEKSSTNISSKLKDISRIFSFPSPTVYKVVFLPAILQQIQYHLKQSLKQERKNHDCSVVLKCKDPNYEVIHLKVISMRKANEKPGITFGQLIKIVCVFPSKPNSVGVSDLVISPKTYIGYVQQARIRYVEEKNMCDVNHRRRFDDDERSRLVVDEYIIFMKYAEEIYNRNDFFLVVQGLKEIHYYYLQAKAIYRMELFSFGKEVISPTLNIKPCGIPIDASETSFTERELDGIQRSVDVVVNCTQPCSYVCLQTSKPQMGTSILSDIVRQIVKINQSQNIDKKILIISPYHTNLSQILYQLKDSCFNILYLGSKDCEKRVEKEALKTLAEHKKAAAEQLEITRDIRFRKRIKQIDDCIKLFKSDIFETHAPVKALVERNSQIENGKRQLLEKCNIIAGRMEDLCNDRSFYLAFNRKTCQTSRIMCALIDSAENLPETALTALSWFGVEKFILCGDPTKDNSERSQNRLSQLGLTRSLFTRLSTLSTNSGVSHHSSCVINLDES